MFCPTAYLDVNNDEYEGEELMRHLKPLRSAYIKMRVRKRVTQDGGRSIMATDMKVNSDNSDDGDSDAVAFECL